MKFIFATVLLIAAVAADVSHLSREYLPPQGGLNFAASEHHHQQAQYAEQSQDIPQAIGADTYTPEHLIEPSNNLAVEETRPQPAQLSGGVYPRLHDEDIRIEQSQSVAAAEPEIQAQPEETQQQEVAVEQRYSAEESQHVEAEQSAPQINQYVESQFEQQPAAQEFVPQTYGSDIVYSNVPDSGPFATSETEQHYETAASTGIDTQYGSNGGYVY